jgi:hypothetical protein
MSWGDLDEMQKGYITEIIGKPKKTWKVWEAVEAVKAFDGTEKLTDIMKTISWDMEKEHIKLNGSPISEMVFRLFAPTFGYRLQDFNQLADISIWSFTLDKESPSWIESDTKLQFTKLEIIRGGKRMQKSKKTRKLRKNTK